MPSFGKRTQKTQMIAVKTKILQMSLTMLTMLQVMKQRMSNIFEIIGKLNQIIIILKYIYEKVII